MISELIKYFENKKIIILGFGREGQSTYKLIRKYLKDQELYIADQKENFQTEFEYLMQDENAQFISGEKYLENLKEYDVIMKSPGISFAKIDTSEFEEKINSQLELLLDFFDVVTIGVTGTKGKSTTSSLMYKVLKDQGVKSMLLGNIGIPVFDYIDTIEKDTTIVLEMSSHQLEYMHKSPDIAILLNAYEEHLDHYKSFDDYVKAKCNIYKYQTQTDYLFYNSDNITLRKYVTETPGKTYPVSFNENEKNGVYKVNDKIFFNEKEIYNTNEHRNLLGDYNLNNIMFVLAVSEILKLNLNKTKESIANFETLEHRLEFVGEFDHVKYYDNSIATIPMATIEAVKALKDVDSLIIGGMDRGVDYSEFIKYLNECDVRNIICLPKTGHEIAEKLKKEKANIVNNMEDAVKIAKVKTQKGKICLLSPAAASYGFYKNFEERGNLYKKLVKE